MNIRIRTDSTIKCNVHDSSNGSGEGESNDAFEIAFSAPENATSNALPSAAFDAAERGPVTEWDSHFHTSFYTDVRLPYGTHRLRAALLCGGSILAHSPVVVFKCNDEPQQFDAEAGSCRFVPALPCF